MSFDRARARTGVWGVLRSAICVVGAGIAVALAGCSASTRVYNGTPVLTLTGVATGDFSSYIVGITSVILTRKDGFTYPALSNEEQVDLTKRTNLTELLTALGVPQGTYTKVSITLDYSAATIFLKGESTAAKVVTPSSGSLQTLTVKLDPSHPLVLNLDQSAPLAIDVNLAASNSIDQSTNTVTVKPFLTATAQPADTNLIRARGLFVYVSTSKSNFTVNLKPLDDTYYYSGTFGALTVNTSPSTYFDIDGTPYIGSAGLAQIAQQSNSGELSSDSTIVSYGTIGDLSTITPTFNATQVYVGSSAVSPGADEVRGTVSARSGNSLTLRGATYICPQDISSGYPSEPPAIHFESATVDIGPSTKVTEDGVIASGLSTQSISVGQDIYATGQGSVSCPLTSTNSTASLTLNATTGEVRLKPTTLWGTLTAGTTSSATLDLLELGGHAPTDFNFAGTGISSANDANPASYTVDTGTTDESATASGTLLTADGLVTPFGSAPPDFTASAVTPGTSEPSTLIVEWNGGTTSPFTTYGSSGLVVNLGNSSIDTDIIRTGPQSTQLSSLPSSPTILPGCQSGACTSNAEYSIGNAKNGISEFGSASSFLSDLSSTLNGSNSVFKLIAIGTYDSTNNTLYAQRIDVALE
jgi:hypothetical protein